MDCDNISEISVVPGQESVRAPDIGNDISHAFERIQIEESLEEQIPAVIPLNVGGYRFMTRLSTLQKFPDSMLAAMFSGRHKLDRDSNGYFFIDSNGSRFGHVLDYLRHEKLPSNDVAVDVYREAAYYGITSLVEKLQTTPLVARMLVKEAHRAQFPNYAQLKQQIIRIAIDNAVLNRTGEVTIHAFRKTFVPKYAHFNQDHECVADTAHISVGPWNTVADEETLLKCLEQDLMEDGFHIKPHEQRRRCKYFNGQNCQKCIYKITFMFC